MNILKMFIQNFLGMFNVKLVKVPTYVMPQIPFDLFEHVLLKVLHETGPSFKFIQVGANDSLMEDKFSLLIRKYKITGCLVEHIPDLYDRLKLNYSDQPQITLSNVIFSTNKSTRKNTRLNLKKMFTDFFYRTVHRVLSSNLSQDTKINYSEKIEDVECKVHTLKKLYEDLNYDNLHLLYLKSKIDSDEFIYQALDANLYPVIINYECTEMNSAQNYKLKMRLLDEGYRFIDVGAETLCVRQYLCATSLLSLA